MLTARQGERLVRAVVLAVAGIAALVWVLS
jgi:hypothetical protein